ncbi:MAG: hypothetical protein LW860_07090 [Xanthomonadaceae bacterium]|jgi:hypothetical protein|nr:hypothetical protein [Xanthomonadaceae bacterium]
MITLSSGSETPSVQVFRVERSANDRRTWTVVQSGAPVASFPDRDAAADAAHTLASNAWRLRQTVSRVVVMGDDGRPTAFRMYGDPSQVRREDPADVELARAS